MTRRGDVYDRNSAPTEGLGIITSSQPLMTSSLCLAPTIQSQVESQETGRDPPAMDREEGEYSDDGFLGFSDDGKCSFERGIND